MSKQYLANVALKINVKVGGRNTVLVDAISRRIPLVSDRPTIIFGADVTHPHPGEDSSPSIAAVCKSSIFSFWMPSSFFFHLLRFFGWLIQLECRLWLRKIGQRLPNMLAWFVLKPTDKSLSKIYIKHGRILYEGRCLVAWSSMIYLSCTSSLSLHACLWCIKVGIIVSWPLSQQLICLCSKNSLWLDGLNVFFYNAGSFSYPSVGQPGRSHSELYSTGIILFSLFFFCVLLPCLMV